MSRTDSPVPARRPRGFSLVEILIAIIILALGLLGLGALFPVVVRQQRISSDQTLGVIVAEQARAKLQLSPWFDLPGSAVPRSAWDALFYSNEWLNEVDERHIRSSPVRGDERLGEWYTGTILADTLDAQRGLVRGAAVVGAPTPNTGPTRVAIPLVERLYPPESDRPILVWDFAVQVTPGQPVTRFNPRTNPSPLPPPMRAAVFVRRIDPRLRGPSPSVSVRETLLGGPNVSTADQRSPLGVDNNGVPTQDGSDGAGAWAYAALRTTPVRFAFNPAQGDVRNRRDRLYLPGNPTDLAVRRAFDAVSQPGQKLVDNLGNIYTVTGSGQEAALSDRFYVEVSPPVPGAVGLAQAAADPASALGRNESIREVVFSPQVPVSVSIVEVNK